MIHMYLMAHPNLSNHVVTRIREALGLSRQELARRIGVSNVYLSKIEHGERELTDEIAFRIFVETGVPRAELLKGKNGRAIDVFGKEITKESYALSRQRSRE